MIDEVTTLGKLERIAAFANQHGGGRAEIVGLSVRIWSEYTHFVDGKIAWGEMSEDVRTMQEARAVLGY